MQSVSRGSDRGHSGLGGRVRRSDMNDRSAKSNDPSPYRRLWPRSDWHVSTMFGRPFWFGPAEAYGWQKIKTWGSAKDAAPRRRSLALLHCLASRIRAKQRSGSAIRQGATRMAALRAELQHLPYQAEPR